MARHGAIRQQRGSTESYGTCGSRRRCKRLRRRAACVRATKGCTAALPGQSICLLPLRDDPLPVPSPNPRTGHPCGLHSGCQLNSTRCNDTAAARVQRRTARRPIAKHSCTGLLACHQWVAHLQEVAVIGDAGQVGRAGGCHVPVQKAGMHIRCGWQHPLQCIRALGTTLQSRLGGCQPLPRQALAHGGMLRPR